MTDWRGAGGIGSILWWVAERAPDLVPGGALGRIRLLEMLAFVSTELHKPLVRGFFPTSELEKTAAQQLAARRLGLIAERLAGEHLIGGAFSAADPYLYVMLRWARAQGLSLPLPLPEYFERVHARPSVRLALKHEGLA